MNVEIRSGMSGSLVERTVRTHRVRWRWARAGAVAVGIASFMAVSTAIGLATDDLPRAWKISVLGQKLAHLRQNPGAYDTLFIGSSRVHYGADPQLFDEEMAQQGCSSRSFNMAVQALTVAEEHRLVQELAAIGHWERVVLERNPPPLRPLQMLGTDRGAFGFGSLASIRLGLLDIWTSPERFAEQAWSTAGVLLVAAYEQIGIGRLGRLINKPGDDEIPTDGRIVDMSRGGFVPIEAETDPVMLTRVAGVDWPRLHDYLRQSRELKGPAEPLSEARAAMIRDQIDHARALAPSVGYVVWPHSRPQWADDARAIDRAAAEGRLGDAVLINLGDPELTPELFAQELWHDNLHLYTTGTNMITQAIAAQMCASERPADQVAGDLDSKGQRSAHAPAVSAE
jgi:hypothetical protein